MDKYLKQTWYIVARDGRWTSYRDIDNMLTVAQSIKDCRVITLSQQESDIIATYALIMGKAVTCVVVDRPQRMHANPHKYVYPYSDNDLALLL